MPRMQSDVIALDVTSGNGHVLIESTVMTKLSVYRQGQESMPEAGGILLGYRRDPHLHVIDATVPSQDDRGQRTRFWRSASAHQQVAQEAWRRSGGTLDYVGEWHTHPQLYPCPSTIDIGEWAKISASRRGQEMIFLVLGTEYAIWLGVDDGRGIRKLRQTSIDCLS
ncbi:Mov34/MPN/PAD-1 family protein [Stenotrophomonas hibiscicola]|uniref:Mov34/MPN/PAD-1 family protein n=1 Tax=Stenotrophomonas hibiscicola TaxID=86189 RepID=UPI003D16DDFA